MFGYYILAIALGDCRLFRSLVESIERPQSSWTQRFNFYRPPTILAFSFLARRYPVGFC